MEDRGRKIMKENMLDKTGREITPSKYSPYDCRGGRSQLSLYVPHFKPRKGDALPSLLSFALA